MSTVELLAPAGNPEALAAALGEGADAVYLGLKTFNARIRSSNFAFNQFEAAVETVHKAGKKLYVTVNTVFVEREADRLFQLLQYLERVGPDGIIVQDLGVVKLAKDNFPKLRLHASTQMNVGSAKGANFLSRQGFRRVVLSRELSLDEIRGVAQGTNLEVETFVHGALCVSASGLCMFSSYLGGKSANRGLCAQACRRLYSTENDSGYWFSPDDLQLVAKVPELVEAGVAAFKIEGRLKSQEYVGAVVSAYRYMLDNWRLDRERALAKAESLLQADFARGKTSYYIDGSFAEGFIKPLQAGGTGIKLGRIKEIRGFDTAGRAESSAGRAEKPAGRVESSAGRAESSVGRVEKPAGRAESSAGRAAAIGGTAGGSRGGSAEAGNSDETGDSDAGRWILVTPRDADDGKPAGVGAAGIAEGDSIRIHRADDSGRFTAKVKEVKENPRGLYLRVETPRGSLFQNDEVYLVQTKSMGKRYKPVLPKELGRYHKFPSRDAAPRAQFPRIAKDALKALPEGLYCLVGRIADLHVLLSERPKKAMIFFDRKNAELMRRHEKELPFKRDSLVIWLDPWFPESTAARLEEDLAYWIGRGQLHFVANNLAHLGMLRGKKGPGGEAVTVIAGPWLYTFNPHAAAFVLAEGADFIIPPYEVGKQDFQLVAEGLPAGVFMPIAFSFPPLFRMRADLAATYDFKEFRDRDGSVYELHSGGDYSTVTPATPFSIVDRIPFLKKEGVGRFILDFSGVELRKGMYRQVFKAAEEGRVLEETSRFNWKDGFWRPPEEGSDTGRREMD